MKSKISFFNMTIFLKNIKTFFPIWLIYFLVLLVEMPLCLWKSFATIERSMSRGNTYTKGEITEMWMSALRDYCDISFHCILIIIMAAITGMALFYYLFNSKSANMFHALPLTKGDLYTTNVICGILFMWIPQLIIFFISVVVCLAYKCTLIWVVGEWFLCVLAISFLMYSIVCFCVMFTGQVYAVPIYYAIVNFLFIGVRIIGIMVINVFSIGVYSRYYDSNAGWLSPAYYILKDIDISLSYNDTGHVTSLTFRNTSVLGIYCLVALAIYIISFVLYKIRDIESAGDYITFGIIEPVFRWGFGCCGGFIISIFLYEIIHTTFSISARLCIIISAVSLGIVLFFCCEMLLRKNFKVFKKKRLIECASMVGLIVVLFALGVYTGSSVSKNKPEKEDVEVAFVDMDFPVKLPYEEVAEMQDRIVNNFEELDADKSTSEQVFSITIGYRLKDGGLIKKEYALENTDLTKEILNNVLVEEEKSENLKAYALASDTSLLASNCYSGSFSTYKDVTGKAFSGDLNAEQLRIILGGIEKDIEEGNINCFEYYQAAYLADLEYEYSDSLSIAMVFDLTDSKKYSDSCTETYDVSLFAYENSQQDFDSNYYYWGNTEYSRINNHLYITKSVEISYRCVNTLNAFVLAGVVDSVEELDISE